MPGWIAAGSPRASLRGTVLREPGRPRLKGKPRTVGDVGDHAVEAAEQQDDSSYTLTALGADAYRALSPLNHWAEGWADALAEQTANHQTTTENEV